MNLIDSFSIKAFIKQKILLSLLILLNINLFTSKENNPLLQNKNKLFSHQISDQVIFPEKIEEILKLQDQENCLQLNSSSFSSLKNLSDNQKFILGKCNPVLLIPGYLGTRIRASIECKKIVNDSSKISELRFFCGENICKDSFFTGYDTEEYTLWPSLFNSPFKLLQDDSNPDNACLAYFMRIFNNEDECPYLNPESLEKKSICLKNKFVKISYFGDTEKTSDKSKCGIKSISRILDFGYPIIPEKYTNSPATEGYYKMSEYLKSKGYSEGFSLAGLPYDFREFSKKNEIYSKKFFEIINYLHENTGKKVIVITHSLANLFTNDILSDEEKFPQFEKLIKKNIALVPPFIGTSKDLEVFITGTLEFKAKILPGKYIDLSLEAQKFMGAFNPNFYLLFLQPLLHNLYKKEEYKEFTDAIFERINLERKCKRSFFGYEREEKLENFRANFVCDDNYIEKNSQKFSKLFPFIPKLNSNSCKKLSELARHYMNKTDFNNIKDSKRKDIYENLPSYDSCFLRMYDFLNCPLIKEKYSNVTDVSIENFEDLCFDKHENKNEENTKDYFFANNCMLENNNLKICQENFIKQNVIYDTSKLFNSKSVNKQEKIPEQLNFNNTEFQQAVEIMLNYTRKIKPNKDLNIPLVPTSIIYGSFLDTKTSYFYNKEQNETIFDSKQIYFHGGDGTVSTYSSLLPGLKWLYDLKSQKKNSTNSEIEIISYCSMLSKDPEFSYFENLKNNSTKKTFYGLDCECLGEDGYIMDKVLKDTDKCSHSTMISDKNVIDFVYISSINEKMYDNIEEYSEGVKRAFGDYKDKDYEKSCNLLLRNGNKNN